MRNRGWFIAVVIVVGVFSNILDIVFVVVLWFWGEWGGVGGYIYYPESDLIFLLVPDDDM